MCTGRDKVISNHANFVRRWMVTLGSECKVRDADISALDDLLAKLVGDRQGRTDCFEDIWNHPVFERFGGPQFRDELLWGEVEHDSAVTKIIRRKVRDTLQDAPADAKRQFKLPRRRRRLLLTSLV